MRIPIPFLSKLIRSPFRGVREHAEKVKECAWAFQHAIECHFSSKCDTFEELRENVVQLENEADEIKRKVREQIPKGASMRVDRFQLFMYMKEQDKVLDAVEDALDWISYRSEPGIPKSLEKEFLLLMEAIIDPIEELSQMVAEAGKYFDRFSEKNRKAALDIIQNLNKQEHDADKAEDMIKQKVLNMDMDAVTVFHTVRLAEIIGSVADHAENAGDMMQAMLAKK